MTSLRRSKTFHGSSRQGEQQTKFETKPGPFATIKVSKAGYKAIQNKVATLTLEIYTFPTIVDSCRTTVLQHFHTLTLN